MSMYAQSNLEIRSIHTTIALCRQPLLGWKYNKCHRRE
jgi:hypothetical protein